MIKMQKFLADIRYEVNIIGFKLILLEKNWWVGGVKQLNWF